VNARHHTAAARDATAQPVQRRLQANGITLACFEWRPECRGQGPSLLIVHATGFHARVWDEVIRRLPGRHVLALEQRGHGRSQAAPFAGWEVFGKDLSEACVALGLAQAMGIGHSMGAHALVQAAAAQPQCFSQLLLIDPVMRPPAEYLLPPVPPGTLHPAAGRKNHFESAQAMAERFASRPPYSVFDPQALRDYCEHGLRPADSGSGFQLCCDPAFEAQVYPLARNLPGIYACIRAIEVPVTVVRARPQDPSILPWDPLGSPTWPELAGEFRRGRDLLTTHTHMMPMEDPAFTAGLIGQALANLG